MFYEFDDVDSFTVGAIGAPGSRTFFLQATHGPTRVAVKCEKQQASAIAEYLTKVLEDLPAVASTELPPTAALTEPVEAVFVLGPVGLGYDRASDRVLVQLEEVVDVGDSGEAEPDALDDRGHLRVFLTRSQAQSFCDHAASLVAAGRPACIYCGLPIDPDGHPCPRMN
ncbi:MAG: DUF3090 family protein [Ilumatobacteraceae bacterium]